jgi:hypothetical protein
MTFPRFFRAINNAGHRFDEAAALGEPLSIRRKARKETRIRRSNAKSGPSAGSDRQKECRSSWKSCMMPWYCGNVRV